MNSTEETTFLVSKKPTIVKENMYIGPEHMGYVVGCKLSKVNRLKKIYGVEITLRERGGSQIVIKGSADMVAAAKKDIEESLACETFFVEKEFVAVIIGPKGERIKTLRIVHNVNIRINNEGEVVVFGKKSEREAAKKAIESIINQNKIDEPYKETFSVTADLRGYAAGFHISDVYRIESIYNVHVYQSSTKFGLSEILVKGASAENVSAAKKDMIENCPLTLSLDEGMFDGREETIRRLKKEHEAQRNLFGARQCQHFGDEADVMTFKYPLNTMKLFNE